MILEHLPLLIALPARENASAAAPITTIDIPQMTNFTAAYGGNQSINSTPDVGVMISEPIQTYAHTLGVSAWVILFACPFIMMWLAHYDLRLSGIIGMIMGLYILSFIPSQYLIVGLGCFGLAFAVTVWGLYQKRP